MCWGLEQDYSIEGWGWGVLYIHIYRYCVGDWSRIIAELSPGFTDGLYGRRHIDGGLRDES